MKNLKRFLYVKLARRLSRSTTGAPVPTIVSENSRINGDIFSDGTVHVDGQLEGNITCDELVIGVKGVVIGTVKAANLQLFGTIKGKAEADDLFVAKSAKLLGDAMHNTLAIEPGAYIDGHCVRRNTLNAAEKAKAAEVVVPIVVKKEEKKNRAKKAPVVVNKL